MKSHSLSSLFLLFFAIPMLFSACGFNKASQTKIDIENNEIDLSQQLKGEWETVCVLTPYSTSEDAFKLMGVEYDADTKSRIGSSDSISLLVTIQNGEVVGHHEVNRGNVDFATLGAGCYPRTESTFTFETSSSSGRSEVIQKQR